MLTGEQKAIQDMALDFAMAEMAPNAMRWDEEKIFPTDVLRSSPSLVLPVSILVKNMAGQGWADLKPRLFSKLCRRCTSTAAFLTIHNMASWMIDSFGNEDQRAKFIPPLMRMDMMASYCLTEPGSGSDAAAMRSRAQRDGDHYILNGSKAFISGAGYSDLYVAMVRTGDEGANGVSCFLVEKDTPGLCFGANQRKMGWNSPPTAQVIFEDCRVPAENLLGNEGDGFKFAMKGLDGGRLNIAACSLAAAGL